MLVTSFMHPKRVQADDIERVIRANALQIVDEEGRIRAELKVSPAVVSQANKTVVYPEAVELRLLDNNGTIVAGFAGTEEGGEIAIQGKYGTIHVNTRQPPPLLWTVLRPGGVASTIP
jgi:DNA/RNA endonuclease YhcR with UshA esterase domain